MTTSDSLLAEVRRHVYTAFHRSSLRRTLSAAIEGSRVLAIPSALGTTAHHARVTQYFRRLRRWGRHSFLYRWLTKEPEPDVIVIDLRETYTVGPLLAGLDRLAGPLDRSYRHSKLRSVADSVALGVTWLASTRVGRLLGRALAPPDPPSSRSDAERQSQSDDDRDDSC